MSVKIGYLAEAISRQSVKAMARILLTVDSKMREERNDLKIELFIKRGAELNDLEKSQFTQFVKNERDCFTKRYD